MVVLGDHDEHGRVRSPEQVLGSTEIACWRSPTTAGLTCATDHLHNATRTTHGVNREMTAKCWASAPARSTAQLREYASRSDPTPPWALPYGGLP